MRRYRIRYSSGFLGPWHDDPETIVAMVNRACGWGAQNWIAEIVTEPRP